MVPLKIVLNVSRFKPALNLNRNFTWNNFCGSFTFFFKDTLMKNFYFEKLVYFLFSMAISFFRSFLTRREQKTLTKQKLLSRWDTLSRNWFFDKIIIVPMFLKPNGLELGNIKGLLHLGPNLMNLSYIATWATKEGSNLNHRFKFKDEGRIWLGNSNANRL